MIFVRYFFVQLVAYAIDMFFYIFLLTFLSINAIYANILSKFFAGLFAFFIQREFTFKFTNNQQIGRQAFRYIIILLLNIPISASILYVILLYISNYIFAKFLSDVVGITISFLLSKYYTFVKN